MRWTGRCNGGGPLAGEITGGRGEIPGLEDSKTIKLE